MIPKQVKNMLVDAVNKNDPNIAWPAVIDLVRQDMYINVAKPAPTQSGRMTVARWGDRPCKCGCGEMIPVGTKVWWEPNWGISIPAHVGKAIDNET